jgi:opacity protein-like surface antigen
VGPRRFIGPPQVGIALSIFERMSMRRGWGQGVFSEATNWRMVTMHRFSSYSASHLLFACIVFVGFAARAEEQGSGFYGSVRVGPSFFEGMSFAEASTADLDLDPRTGWLVGGALGYRIFDAVRLELDLAYAASNLRGTFQENVQAFVPCGEFAGNPCLDRNVDGDISALTSFASAYYDFPRIGQIKPFVGLGIGLVDIDLDVGTRATLNDGPVSRFAIVHGSDTALGYRGALGFSYDVGAVDLAVGYSYTFAQRSSFAGDSPLVSFSFDPKVSVHALSAGLVYKF